MDAKSVKILAEETVYQGFLKLKKIRLTHPTFAGDELEVTRELLDRSSAVGVLLYDAKLDQLVLVKQFRIGALVQQDRSPWLLEPIAGMVELGESAIEVAKREAMEEAGAELLELLPIVDYFVSPGGTNERIGLYCAKVDSSQMGGIFGLESEQEDIQVQILSSTEAFALLQSGEIDNAAAIICLQWLQLNLDKLQQQWG